VDAGYSGTEGALLLAMVKVILDENLYDREFMRTWVDWRGYLRSDRPDLTLEFDNFILALKELYAQFTPEFAADETGVDAAQIVAAARAIGRARGTFSTHNWRSAAAGNLWGWQITRCLYLLVVLTGSVGTKGGVGLHLSNKFVPKHPTTPPAPDYWNELLFPREYPLAFFEMSFLLPHLLKENRGRIDVYFTRVYNPLWTNPDGFSWMEMLTDRNKIGLHVALTPTWSETAWFADYILPMGLGTERHDTMSQETHAAQWLGFRQPVLPRRPREARRNDQRHLRVESGRGVGGKRILGRADLAHRSRRLARHRRHFESPYRPGQPVTMDEYYGWMFENSVPGLPEAAAQEALTPLAYMRKYGVFKVKDNVYKPYETPLSLEALAGAVVDRDEEIVLKDGAPIGVLVDGVLLAGFTTPSRRLEFRSQTLVDWGWPEHAIPRYVPGHVHWRDLKPDEGEFDLLPNFRLPTLVHTRSPVKWLYEISHDNPLWIATPDATATASRPAISSRSERGSATSSRGPG
jgi:anaerobic selenocysteine-containing dehydrogenase